MIPDRISIVRTFILVICGSILAYFFNCIADASIEFEQGTSTKNRPIVTVLSWFWYAFAAYCVAWAAVGGFSISRRLPGKTFQVHNLLVVFLFAIAFRILLTPSVPIQEIDIYRYVWDGAVVSNKLDPFHFGPKTVHDAAKDPSLLANRKGLEKYTSIVDRRPGLNRILEIIHYGQYTSPYPPVSQAVFGLAVSTVKPDADAKQYITAMKTALVIFDLLTGIVVAMLLYHVGMNPTLCLGYLWCPLVLKEIANGGHLDSIATFFAALAVYFTTRALWVRPTVSEDTDKDEPQPEPEARPPLAVFSAAASAISLAAAFSAKVFPIVLVPIWFIILLRRSGFQAIFPLTLFLVAAYFFSLPMLKHLEFAKELNIVSVEADMELGKPDDSGLEVFSKYWEMNDFLFMLCVENIKPSPNVPASEDKIDNTRHPWFVFTNNQFRNHTIESSRGYFEDPNDPNRIQHKPSHFAFFTTRLITMAIFSMIVAWACLKLLMNPDRIQWLEMAFLTLAWFWLLSPTQNPWYWTWAIPLLVFARGRIWVFLSGTLLAYYLRFWFEYQFTGTDVMGYWKENFGDSWVQEVLFPLSSQYAYQGNRFFDMYVPVLEFGPWMVLLLAFAIIGFITRRGTK